MRTPKHLGTASLFVLFKSRKVKTGAENWRYNIHADAQNEGMNTDSVLLREQWSTGSILVKFSMIMERM